MTQKNIASKKSKIPTKENDLVETKLSKPNTDDTHVELENDKFVIKNYQEIIDNNSLENTLLKYGYTPISKIVVRNVEKNIAQYVKCINIKGQKVFIELDVKGFSRATNNDMTIIDKTNANIVQLSTKNGAYKCVGNEVCGVAIECGSDGVCIISHGSDGITPIETTYMYIAGSNNNDAGCIMTYPIIKLSEIVLNPDLIVANTSVVISRLRTSAYTDASKELSELQESITQFNNLFVEFDKTRNICTSKIISSKQILNKYCDEYISNPPKSDEQKENFANVKKNLLFRNDCIEILIRTIVRFSSYKDDINRVNKYMEEYINILQSKCDKLDYVD